MADLPFDLGAEQAEQLARVLDVEGKIPRALEALGPVGGRDVVFVDGPDGIRASQLADMGARVTLVASSGPEAFDVPAASADTMIAAWSAFQEPADTELAHAERILRPGGRLLVVQDYGRDDVATMLGEPSEPRARSRPGGAFLGNGFKIRVIHCFMTFPSIEAAGPFLADAFGDGGRARHAAMTRPRLSYNVAVYHRTVNAAVEEVST